MVISREYPKTVVHGGVEATLRTKRIQHECKLCWRMIQPGEAYYRIIHYRAGWLGYARPDYVHAESLDTYLRGLDENHVTGYREEAPCFLRREEEAPCQD